MIGPDIMAAPIV